MRLLTRFLSRPSGAIGLVGFVLFAGLAIFAPLLAYQNPYDLGQLDIMSALLPPGSPSSDGTYTFLFGTDDQGRDIYSAILYGLRVSISVAFLGTAVASVLGISAGLCAAYFRGVFDTFIMRVVDLQLAFPSVLTALVLVALLGSGVDKVVIAIVAAQWAYFARTLRASAMIENTKEYIQATHVMRFSPRRIMFKHLLPNSVSSLGVVIVVEIANAIALEATLSFLGIGLPVTQPSLGLLIANGYSYMLSRQYWVSAFPGMALLLLVLCVNLIGERLRQMNNPWGIK